MASSNQGGSILSFLLIGGILTALLVGGVYVVQQRSASSPSTPSPVVAPSNNAPNKTPAPAADEKKVAVESNKEAAKQEAAKKEEAQKETPKPAAPAQVTPPVRTELPETGLAENFSAILGVGLLSGMTVAYVRSRTRSATL